MLRFRYGYPNMTDHLPEADISGGDVIVVGDTPRVAHRDMKEGVLGALASGGGIYEGICDGAVEDGSDAWWSESDEKLTDNPQAGDTHFGIFLWSTDADGDTVRALHGPRGETT